MSDFETTTDENDCRVWLWGIVDIEDLDVFEWGIDIESFVEKMEGHNAKVNFHNLGFDGKFILWHLLMSGYVWVNGKYSPNRGEFKTLIDNMGKFYSITVTWNNGKQTQFTDTLKKFPGMSVAKIAKTFKYEESKGELDYHKYRPVGYMPDEQELDYLRRDLLIPAKAVRQTLVQGMKSLTIASDALSEYKDIMTAEGFQRIFPVLSDEMDNEIRRALRGGFTYADPRFSKCVTRSGIVLDVNSLYPSIMRTRELPYGIPEFVEGEVLASETRSLCIFSITFTAKLKKDHIPCIQIKGTSIFMPTEYLTEIEEPTTLMVTNVDWELYNRHYDIDVLEYGGGWRFLSTAGLFNKYIDKWAKVKETSTGGVRELAKLFLNSLFGKFGANPLVQSKEPYLDENDVLRFRQGEDEHRAPIYTAMAVFITSYARELTITAAQDNYDTFAYADTDSLHLLRDDIPLDLDVHPTRMGAWKLEYRFHDAFYVRPKFYLEREATYASKLWGPADMVVKLAGMPERESSKLTYDALIDGRKLTGKLQPKSVRGGVVLNDVEYTLKL